MMCQLKVSSSKEYLKFFILGSEVGKGFVKLTSVAFQFFIQIRSLFLIQ